MSRFCSCGPFCDHDRIKRRVSDRAVLTWQICSPHTLELGTESLDGPTGALVSDIGSQADAMNLPEVEGMGKKKKFGFRITAGPLRRGSKPGVPDFKGVRPILALEVMTCPHERVHPSKLDSEPFEVHSTG